MHTGLPSICNIGLSMSLSAMTDVVNCWHNLKDLRKGTSAIFPTVYCNFSVFAIQPLWLSKPRKGIFL